ncbi:MAG: hypothetical protein CVT95_03660 [Bacteroidetes bacterium HGW-Bacteroidetes-12]|nr:MAG: hypothetical protein CVT95_03660 [Bacteroidetes bacterium HGW-Bacteroidetes-12]
MRNFAPLSVFLILFSCQEIKFKEPQPIETPVLNSFPTELIGSYYDLKRNDTLIVNPTTFTFGNKSSLTFISAGLSDSVILKAKDHVYYLNLFDKEKKLWNLIVFRNDVVSNLHVSLFVIENNEQVEKIKAITPLEPVLNEEKEIDYYIAQPNELELKQIVSQQLFSKSTELKKIIKQ